MQQAEAHVLGADAATLLLWGQRNYLRSWQSSPASDLSSGTLMKRLLGIVAVLTALVSCRDYDFQSRLTSQGGLVPADQFARYGKEQAAEMAIAREFSAAIKHSSSQNPNEPAEVAMKYARTLPEVADIQADPLGYRLTIRFKSGWRTMVVPVSDGKRAAASGGQAAKPAEKKAAQ
jgi:hypothetical protein